MARLPASLVVLALCRVAAAQPAPAPEQPQDPYAVPAGQDPVLAEQVATSLVTRAQELVDQQMWVEAKQLAVEAANKSPKGPAAERAHAIIQLANQQLGIKDEAPPPPQPPDLTPIQDPTLTQPPPVMPPVAEGPVRSGKMAATVHGAVYFGLLGATVGSFFDDQNPAGGAVPVGIAAGLAGALFTPGLAKKYDEAQVRTVGSASVWGGVIGGLFADVVTGANGGQASAQGVLVGASLGSTVTALVSTSFAKEHKLTRGDVALVDTLAGVGTVGGLTIGMLMQPAQAEAYSMNSVIGAAAGVVTGLVMAPKTNTTPRRMIRVAGLAAAGGGLPFLLYAGIHNSHKTWDDRLTGGLSTLGLLAGAGIGFYVTRHIDEGLDVQDGKAATPSDAPIALVGRSSDGRWAIGGLGLQPTSPQLSPQHGVTMTVLGATF